MVNFKFDQIDCINNFFFDTSENSGMHLSIDAYKPPKFDDPPLESSGIC